MCNMIRTCMKILIALEQNFECCPLSRATYPSYLRNILLEGFIIISVVFAGHSSEESDFVAVLLAQAIVHVTCYVTYKVLTEVLEEELYSEMLRFGVNKLITVHAMKFLAISWTAGLAIAILWLNGGNLSLLCFQDALVSQKVNTYLLIYTSILPVYPILMGCLSLLDASGCPQTFTNLVLITGNCMQILLTYILCYPAGLGVKGMAIGPVVSYYIVAIPILYYMICKRFTCQVFYTLNLQWMNEWGKYVTAGFPIWLRICTEDFLFHAGLFIVGTPGPDRYTEISVYGILLYLYSFLSLWSVSMGGGISVRLKRLLQNRFLPQVRNSLLSSVVWCSVTALIQSLTLAALSQWVGWIFSGDATTVTLAGQLMYSVAIVSFCRCIQECLRGQTSGWGLANKGWVLAIISFIIGITFATLFATLWLRGTEGFWLGLLIRSVFILLWVLVATVRRYKAWFKELETPPLPIMSPSTVTTEWEADRVMETSYDGDSTVFKSIKVESNIGSYETTPELSPGSSLESSLETRDIAHIMRLVQPNLDIVTRPHNLKLLICKRILLVTVLATTLVAMSVCKSIKNELVVNISTNFSAAVSICCISFTSNNYTV